MKKLSFRKFIFLMNLATVFAFVFGCSLVETENVENEKGKVILYFSENESRTVLPSSGYLSESKDIEFFKKGSTDSDFVSLAKWTNYADFYKSTKEYEFDSGNYTFRLTLKRYGVLFSQDVSATITSGKNTNVNFNALEIDSSNEAKTGSLSISLDLPESIYDSTKKVTIQVGTQAEEELSLEEKKESYLEYNGYGYRYTYKYWWKVSYKTESIEEGNYLVTFRAYNESNDVIFSYPTYAVIEKGYPSIKNINASAKESIEKTNEKSVKVTYISNYSAGTEEKTFEQTFYAGSAIVSAQTAGFSLDGKKLKRWNTSSDGSGTTYLSDEQPSLEDNTTLYAIWSDSNSFEITYYLNPDDSTTQSKTFVQEENGSASLKSINDAGFSYSKNFMGWDTNPDGSGTRYNSGDSVSLDSDMKLYAQWCTFTSGSYEISSNREWNAFFNANQNKTSISGRIKLTKDIESPNMTFTKGKTLNGSFTGTATKSDGTYSAILNPKHNLFDNIGVDATVKGISINFTEKNITILANGFIANENSGTIDGCDVNTYIMTKPTLSSESLDAEGTGGLVGKNFGNISSCAVSYVTINGTTCVGGLVGRNKYGGTIGEKCFTEDCSVFGNDYWGYVIGYNEEGGTVGCGIETDEAKGKELVNKTDNQLTNASEAYYDIILDRSAKVFFFLKDSSEGKRTNKETLKLLDSKGAELKTFVNKSTPNVETYLFLNKGTYKLCRNNSNGMYTSRMDIKVVLYN